MNTTGAQTPDAAGMRAYVEELRATFMRLQEEAPALHEKARAVQVTEKSRDGLVAATVGANGDLIRLDLDPRIYRRQDARGLADAITRTIHAAVAKAQDRVVEIFAPLIPAEQMRAHIDGDLDAVLEQMSMQMPKRTPEGP
ncbi:YbaB/EbfC family nucleoid-associated protein [Microbispora catharanthi]|uniref:YbaB/EbfC family DNA-binding protein n=1 Tax=Microbispora catharanthi TaxID=1712871 RepID=A0A5N6C1A2_9ACTN|nr:YbaB/EbfC family nucleoid-associated protein [Microbispora catharanthi]KAB8186535.1 YbaB/EbfC family DNA-binding protein [Microbispora catharanthi]